MKFVLLGWLFVLSWTVTAHSAPRIALLSPNEASASGDGSPQDPLIEATRQRLRAELMASGFEIVSVTAEGTGRRSVEAAAIKHNAFAAIFLGRVQGAPLVDVWISDRLTNKTVVRTLELNPDDPHSPSTVALRVVELLQASLIELEIAPTEGAAPDEVARLIDETKEPRSGGWWLAWGPSVSTSWGQRVGVGMEVSGVYRWQSGLGTGVVAYGPYWGSDLQAAAGHAGVTDGLLGATLEWVSPRGGVWASGFGVALGAYGASVAGQGTDGFVGRRAFVASPAGALHVLGAWRWSTKSELRLKGFVAAATHPLVVRIDDFESAPFACPLLGLSLSLASRL